MNTVIRQQGFKQLLVWQRAYELVLDVYHATAAFPAAEKYGLASQMQRAAVSVPANIAEGYERGHRGEYLQFLSISRGSLGELETYLMLANDLRYIDDDRFHALEAHRSEVGGLLRLLWRSLERSK